LVQQASPRPATEKDQSIITYNKSRIDTRAGGNKKSFRPRRPAGRPAAAQRKKGFRKEAGTWLSSSGTSLGDDDVKFCKQLNQELQQLQEELMLLPPPAPTTSDAEVFFLACLLACHKE
jgi:hypothetical protein